MNSTKKWFYDSVRLSRKLLAQQWVPLLTIFVIGCILTMTAEDAMQLSTPADESRRWSLQLVMGLWDLLEGVMLILILSWGIPKVRTMTSANMLTKPFETPYIQSFLAEYLRVLAQILMWGLLLLLPGFWRYCQLIFVPFITVFSKSYREGEVDALRLSEKLARGRIFPIIGVILATMALQVALEFLPEIFPDLHILPLRVAFAACSFLISVWTFSLIFLMFEDAMEAMRPEEQ